MHPLTVLHPIPADYVQLASLASRPDPAADTLDHYQALPVAHHQLE